MTFLAKIAAELRQAVARRRQEGSTSTAPSARVIASGECWSVEDLTCTCGRQDRPFEEEHASASVAIVLAGTFQYCTGPRAGSGHLMTSGSLLLGNPGQSFRCSHEHAAGDRCLSFHFSPGYFEQIAADAGARPGERIFRIDRLPLLRELSPVVAHACSALARASSLPGDSSDNLAGEEVEWEEIALQLAAVSIESANQAGARRDTPSASTIARVTRAVRRIEEDSALRLSVRRLALDAGLSPYHFLRTFQQLTGVTPHRYILRTRLRNAAAQLLAGQESILDAAMDCGFGDVSNFNHAFRNEFGVSPRQFRRQRVA
jgi:AraC family transcriptional regulator